MARMRALLVAASLAAVILAAAPPAAAHPAKGGPFGIGVILGDPSGFTGKYYFDAMQALDFHIGVAGFHRYGEFGLYADYLFHFDLKLRASVLTLAIYFGPGLGLIFDYDDRRYCNKWRCYDDRDDDGVYPALRVPVGVALWFKKFAGEVFFELSPSVYFRHTNFDLDVAAGFRYYF